jgi:hypothetical protein
MPERVLRDLVVERAASPSRPQNRSFRSRVCDICGRVDTIRADTKATRCSACARHANGMTGAERWREIARKRRELPFSPSIQATCPQCGVSFPTTNYAIRMTKVHCCSRNCRWLYCGAQRTCKSCGQQFRAIKSQVKGIARSNSSANFCSRQCYHRWLCKPDRVSGRGSQWMRTRKAVLAGAPFCAQCGSRRRLDVHHIVPFRITHDNRLVNLIPLCKGCHKVVESILNDAVLTGIPPGVLLIAFGSMLRERQVATFIKLREVARNGKSLRAQC